MRVRLQTNHGDIVIQLDADGLARIQQPGSSALRAAIEGLVADGAGGVQTDAREQVDLVQLRAKHHDAPMRKMVVGSPGRIAPTTPSATRRSPTTAVVSRPHSRGFGF